MAVSPKDAKQTLFKQRLNNRCLRIESTNLAGCTLEKLGEKHQWIGGGGSQRTSGVLQK